MVGLFKNPSTRPWALASVIAILFFLVLAGTGFLFFEKLRETALFFSAVFLGCGLMLFEVAATLRHMEDLLGGLGPLQEE